MRLCRCLRPLYQLEKDGRKPIRCAVCGRRAFKRRPRDKLIILLTRWRPTSHLAGWIISRDAP